MLMTMPMLCVSLNIFYQRNTDRRLLYTSLQLGKNVPLNSLIYETSFFFKKYESIYIIKENWQTDKYKGKITSHTT